MKTSDFDYVLPPELIAQTPSERRDGSRLLRLDRATMTLKDPQEHSDDEIYAAIGDSWSVTIRAIADEDAELSYQWFFKSRNSTVWKVSGMSGNQTPTITVPVTTFGDGELTAEIADVLPDGNRLVKFSYEGIFLEVLERLGKMPLPPYIKTELQDKERYQTVYSRVNGSAAAPTAGLHFTPELMERIRAIGLGTFRPVKEAELEAHEMHREFCTVPEATAALVNATKASGGRVVCVGTTSCRTLESWAAEDGTLRAGSGWTGIYIYPGYRFKVMDALVTNFHLPQSTLLMLVSAFAGRENVLAAYEEAVREGYRFFSFGDAMFVG